MGSVLAHTSRARRAGALDEAGSCTNAGGARVPSAGAGKDVHLFFGRIRERHVRICFVAVGVAVACSGSCFGDDPDADDRFEHSGCRLCCCHCRPCPRGRPCPRRGSSCAQRGCHTRGGSVLEPTGGTAVAYPVATPGPTWLFIFVHVYVFLLLNNIFLFCETGWPGDTKMHVNEYRVRTSTETDAKCMNWQRCRRR